MSDYIQQLEQQNEELKQLLAEEQEKVISLENFKYMMTPEWVIKHYPTPQDSKDNGVAYVFRNCINDFAEIIHREKSGKYHISYKNSLAPSIDPSSGGGYDDINDAKLEVERVVIKIFRKYVEDFKLK